jgi:hypothetical protein
LSLSDAEKVFPEEGQNEGDRLLAARHDLDGTDRIAVDRD